MKRIATVIILAATLLVACGPSREERIEQIEDFEDSIFESAVAADETTADQLTALYTAFADKYPDDTLTPQFLFKAAEVQSNVLHTDEAVALYDRIINDYPDFEDVALCYFLIGNAYEQNGQYEEAKAAYEDFLAKYPDHYMASSTRLMLSRVGMSPEELLDFVLANANDSLIKQ